MISLQGSSALIVFSFFTVFTTANPLQIYCGDCGGPSQLTDYGNFAINQVYGVESWVPYELQDELIIHNSNNEAVHVDLNHVLTTNIIVDLFNIFLPEELELGFPESIQAVVTNSDAETTTYEVRYSQIDNLGPLGVGSAGAEDGGGSSGGVGNGGGTPGGFGGGTGGTNVCTSADSVEWDCVFVPN